MKIKVKLNNKYVLCDVANPECKGYKCLHIGKWLHQSKNIDGVQSSYRDNFYSCLHRNYHGCPDNKLLNKE